MAEASRAPLPALIEAIVLAFTRSPVGGAIGADALRLVLSGRYGALVPQGRLDLAGVWQMLQSQPGVTASAATPAFCLLKTWEARLGLPVDLPKYLTGLSQSERNAQAATCKVPAMELDRVLAGAPPPVNQAVTRAGDATNGADRPRRRGRPRLPETRADKVKLAGATAGAVLSLAVAVFLLFRGVAGGGFHGGPDGEFAAPIPVGAVKQLGKQVKATLTDPAWLSLPEEERRGHMTDALHRLADRGVEVFALFGDDQRLKASAQAEGDGAVVVRFTYSP